MRSILWSQASDATSKDIFVIDGVVSLDEQTREQMTASNKLFECHDWGMLHKDSIQALKKSGKLLNNDFVSYRKGQGYYLSSNYVNKDIVGRQITFQFFCATDDFTQAMDEFVKVSTLIKREFSTSELEYLKQAVLEPNQHSCTSSTNHENKLWLYIIVTTALIILFAKGCGK